MALKSMMIPVRSSAIESIGYDHGSLWVEFHKSGLYEYLEVPPEVFHEFRRSASKGAFFDRYVRGKYPTRKIHG